MPFPSLGDLPDPGVEPRSPALQVDSLLSEPPVGETFLRKVLIYSLVSVWCYTELYIFMCICVCVCIQFILIIPEFHIGKFAYLLKFVFMPKVNSWTAFVVFCGHVQSNEKFFSFPDT